MKITLRDGTEFEAKETRTVLDEARDAKVVLDYSCRTGRCGVCRAMVKSGSTVALKPEVGLTLADQEAGYILTCCRAPTSDLSIDAENLHALQDVIVRTSPARISQIERVRPDIVRVRLRLPPSVTFKFVAGQYVDIIGPGAVRRSYSIASAPDEPLLEFHIREVEAGAMSTYWFGQAKQNDLLRIEGPFGTFFFRNAEETNDNDVVFLATGTGIAPMKSMLETIAGTDAGFFARNRVHLYWGARRIEDLYWSPDASLPGLSYHRVLSQRGSEPDSPAPNYVQYAASAALPQLERAVVYACGSNSMVLAAREHLVGKGLDPNRYHYEAFVSSASVEGGSS